MSFVAAIHGALELPHGDDAASQVHDLVAKALRQLDATAEIRATDYFAHTFVPDLVMRWGSGTARRERHVHLRFSVVTRPFAQDLDIHGDESPVFVGMTDLVSLDDPEWRECHPSIDGTLITQSQAIGELRDGTVQEARTRRATGAVVRGGHGLLDQQRAERVNHTYVSALNAIGQEAQGAEGAHDEVREALDVLNELVLEDGQLEVERALQSEWVRHGRDPYDFPSSTPWDPEMLDTASLREVLLSLLRAEVPIEPETWQRNAGFIRAEDIGRILGTTLNGGKLNAMAHALLANWTAKWVWATRSNSPPLFPTYDWIIENETLGLEVGDLKTFFADDGRHFKDKDDCNPLPTLAEAQKMLSMNGVQEVGLRSPFGGIRYEPLTGPGTVYTRIHEILAAPDSSRYRVQSVTTAIPGTDTVGRVDLGRQVMDLAGQSTPVATLARTAVRLFSRGSRPEGLDHFLATGKPPEPEREVADIA